jgi:ADP-ribosylglycohydrolase
MNNKINNKQISLKTKFRAIMILHALGDTIGFKNGDWEFNYHDRAKRDMLDYVNELIYEFIELGGINGIDLRDWKVSDDTFFHIAMAKSLLIYNKKSVINSENPVSDELINEIKANFMDESVRLSKEVAGTYVDENKKKIKINRYIGVTTAESIKAFTPHYDARDAPYDDYAGGNGAAMRTLCIGMCLSSINNREKLIDLSIISSQLTHNNASGYLGGFNAALFTALAIEEVPIKKWPFILIEYLKSDNLKAYLSLENMDQIYDHGQYIRYWQKYIDTKFDNNGNPLKIRANSNPMHRIRYYHDNFYKGGYSDQIGSSGYLCMIMAYDALLDCDGCWEKLIVYAILHPGDSDTVGAVAGGLYGAIYGFGDVPEHMIKYIERKKELEDLASKLYDKFKK